MNYYRARPLSPLLFRATVMCGHRVLIDLNDYQEQRYSWEATTLARARIPVSLDSNGILTVDARNWFESGPALRASELVTRIDGRNRETVEIGGLSTTTTGADVLDVPIPDVVAVIPVREGAFVHRQDATRFAHPVLYHGVVTLARGGKGFGTVAIRSSEIYVRPGDIVVLADDHEGICKHVTPQTFLGDGSRYGSVVELSGVEPRERPAASCIDVPEKVYAGRANVFTRCADGGTVIRTTARDAEGNEVGTWQRVGNAFHYTPPATPMRVGVTFTTRDDVGLVHVHGVWVQTLVAD